MVTCSDHIPQSLGDLVLKSIQNGSGSNKIQIGLQFANKFFECFFFIVLR